MKIIGSLELLNSLYNDIYLSKKGSDQRILRETENLF